MEKAKDEAKVIVDGVLKSVKTLDVNNSTNNDKMNLPMSSQSINQETLKMHAQYTEKELAFLQKIYNDTLAIEKYYKEIFDKNVASEMQRQQFIQNVQYLHNKTLQYAR